MDKDIFNDKKLLTRFIWKVKSLPDTPALIQFIAGDEDYLALCSRVVNDSTDGARDLAPLRDVCRKQNFDYPLLKERLTPVARAFGLAEDERSYYELLGIPRDADPGRIKKAFRKRVIEVHPDTGDRVGDSAAEFINLKTAYRILADPFLRRKYDETLHDVGLWKEKADPIRRSGGFNSRNFQQADQNSSARTKIYYQLGGLLLLLIIVILIFDFIYRQNAILDDDYSVKQQQTQAAVNEASALKVGQNRPEAKSLLNAVDNSGIQQKPLTGNP